MHVVVSQRAVSESAVELEIRRYTVPLARDGIVHVTGCFGSLHTDIEDAELLLFNLSRRVLALHVLLISQRGVQSATSWCGPRTASALDSKSLPVTTRNPSQEYT